MNKRKQLRKSATERKIAGVSGGLAEFFNVDVNIIRLMFVLFTLLGGEGLLVYFILWLIMPDAEPEPVTV